MTNWIKVSERSPEEKKSHSVFIVVMFSHYKHKTFVEPLHYINGTWYTMLDEEPLDPEYEVTHWQPLPEPPNE